MDKPFPAESSPFLAPYPPPVPAAPGIKPFKAVDLVPPAGGQAWTHALPQASPFLDRDPGKPAPAAEALAPRPMAAPVPNPLSRPQPDGSLSHIFAAPPAAEPTALPNMPRPQSNVGLPPSPIAAPAGPQVQAAALRALETPRPGSGTEIRAKSALIMTDADTAAEAAGAEAAGAEAAVTGAAGAEAISAKAAATQVARLPITTSPNLDGRPIRAYLGIVSVEIVIPKDILFRNPAPYGEMHRIRAAEEQLQAVKSKTFEELADKACALGANAVVGASLQF